MSLRNFLIGLASAAALPACGNNNNSSTGNPCGPLTNVGAAITPMSRAGSPPAMTGGTLVEGTYALTAWDLYNGEHDSKTHQETFLYQGGMVTHVQSINGGVNQELGGSYSSSGNVFTWTITCPQPTSVSVQYTATPTTFMFIAPDDPNQLQTYTKQ